MSGFKSKHLRTLRKRRDYLRDLEATGQASSYDHAEWSALDAALVELQVIVDARKQP